MLEIKCFACNMIQENCYVVSDETHEGIIIDCGAFYESERKAIKNTFQRKASSCGIWSLHMGTLTIIWAIGLFGKAGG